jgi:hypothetical protein
MNYLSTLYQEFKKKVKDAKPVKFIEYCSDQNSFTGSIYDIEGKLSYKI